MLAKMVLQDPSLREGLGFRVWDLGFRIWGSSFRGLGFTV